MYRRKTWLQIIVALVILHLFTLTTIMSSFVPRNEIIAAPHKLDNEFFISEDPLILITHDDNFTTLGFPGDGSPGNPYRIENFNITGGGADLISISNTRKHFIIQNCTLHQSGFQFWGILLTNVENAVIFDNEIYDNWYSVGVNYCTNVTVQKNNITSNRYGIQVYESDDVDILSNDIDVIDDCIYGAYPNGITVKHNRFNGSSINVYMTDINNGWFENNTITHASIGMFLKGSHIVFKNNTLDSNAKGLSMQEANDVLIFDNTFTECDIGLELVVDTYQTVANNTFSDGVNGIIVDQSHDSLFENNTCSGYDVGITVADDAERNWFVGNFLDGNALNAEDNGIDTFFGTNYWSDYIGSDGNGDGIGDTPHPILGSAINADPHPLMTPTTPRYSTTWIQTPTDQLLEFGDPFRYDLNCTAPEPLYWWLSGTYASWFSVDSNGVVTNATVFTNQLNLRLTVWARNIYSFTITSTFWIDVNDTLAPTWDEEPTDQFHEFGHNFYYDLNASDAWGIDRYWINETQWFIFDYDNGSLYSTNPPVGVYELEVRAYDPEDKYVSAVFTVTVADTIPPSVTHPPDQELVEGQGQVGTITWEVDDLSPMSYMMIINGVASEWIGVSTDNAIEYDFIYQSSPPGTYNYTIAVTDGYHTTADTVLVVILHATTTTTTSGITLDGGILVVVAVVGISGVIIVIVVVLKLRKH